MAAHLWQHRRRQQSSEGHSRRPPGDGGHGPVLAPRRPWRPEGSHGLRRRLRGGQSEHPYGPGRRDRLGFGHLGEDGGGGPGQVGRRTGSRGSYGAQVLHVRPGGAGRQVPHSHLPRRPHPLPSGQGGRDDLPPRLVCRQAPHPQLRPVHRQPRRPQEDRGAVPGAEQGHPGVPAQGSGHRAHPRGERLRDPAHGHDRHQVLLLPLPGGRPPPVATTLKRFHRWC
mmetsp:Transcript_25156/g.43427  ORF Transcript_25156/g.43427 Transcript_25156/m.43427 type:complete len:225 (-) Transcript_25156:100-774(-)